MDAGEADAIAAYRDSVNPHHHDVFAAMGVLRTFVDAEGAYVTDADGRRYLDLSAEHGAATLGHRHPRLVEALTDTLRRGSPFIVPLGLSNRSGLLARRLCELADTALERVYFCTGGSEAMESAMKFAMAATGRSGFVGFSGDFHGLTLGPLPLAGHEFWRRPVPQWTPTGRHIVPFGDLDALAKVLAGGEIAAVIMEMVQGVGGAREWPVDDVRAVAALCAAHGTLLIADECLTGVGRTGRWFAFQHAGVAPDIAVVAKGLTGGMVPVAAVMMTRAVHEAVYSTPARAFIHSSTFQGHLLGMVAGLTVLEVMTEERIVARVDATGRLLRERLARLAAEDIGLRAVRGRGLLIGAQIEGITTPESPDGAAALVLALHRRGVLVESAAHDQSWLRLNPPLTLLAASVTEFVDALRDALAELAGTR